MPSLARLSAVFLGLLLSVSAALVNAQTLPDIQRLMKQNQMPQALEKVDIYISTKPKDAQGRFLKGLILTEMGRPADAIAIFTKLTEDFPEVPEPYNNLDEMCIRASGSRYCQKPPEAVSGWTAVPIAIR